MKKSLFSILALAVAGMSLSGCLGLLDALSDSPGFLFYSTVYDGQPGHISLVKDYAYHMEASPAECVSFGAQDSKTKSYEVKSFNYTGNAAKNEVQNVKLTATCIDQTVLDKLKSEGKSLDPFSLDIKIKPWMLRLFKVEGETVTEVPFDASIKVGKADEGGWNLSSAKATDVYVLRMVDGVLTKKDANDTAGEYKTVSDILFKYEDNLVSKPVYQYPTWKALADNILTVDESNQNKYELRFSVKTGTSVSVQGILGAKTHQYGFKLK